MVAGQGWPLPPAGPLEFVCEWPAFGIAESRAGIDARLILDAARHSVRLWPETAADGEILTASRHLPGRGIEDAAGAGRAPAWGP